MKRIFLEEVGNKIGIKKYEDWYKVTQLIIEEHGGRSILWHNNNSLYRALMIAFPEFYWQRWKFQFWRISQFDDWQLVSCFLLLFFTFFFHRFTKLWNHYVKN